MKKILFLNAILAIIMLNIVFAVDWTRIEYSNGSNNGVTIADWNGGDKYTTGWSLWSTTKPNNVGQYAVAKVYITPSWGNESCSTSTKSEVKESYSDSTLVVWNTKNYSTYNDDYSYTECTNNVASGGGVTTCNSCKGGCTGCKINGDYTNYCNNGELDCSNGFTCDSPEAIDAGFYTKCRKINCPQNESKSGCTSDEVSSIQGCGIYATYHCYKTATSYPAPNSIYSTSGVNWKKTLADAGGYARVIYIYSYPQRVFIKYDGNGSNGTCTSRPASTYKDPTICTAYGSTNLMNDSYISYYDTEPSPEGVYNLSNNLFYRTGYDFLGWSTNKNATSATYGNQESVRIAKAGVTHTQKEIVANAGDTVTLYAIWKRHDYKITYTYYCGNSSALTKIYNYEVGLTLQNLNVADGQKDSSHEACDTNSKSYYDETNSNTKFEGWYTDSNYVNKITVI